METMTGRQKLLFSNKSLYFSSAATFDIYDWKFTGYLILTDALSVCAKKILQNQTISCLPKVDHVRLTK